MSSRPEVEIIYDSRVKTCGICGEDLPLKYKFLDGGCPNGHVFHEPCAVRWIMQDDRCPLCREELPENPILRTLPVFYEWCKFCKFVVADPELSDDLRSWLIARTADVYHKEHFVSVEEEFYERWPDYDPCTLGEKFWRLSLDRPDIQDELVRFVIRQHTCNWECEETPCFLKRLSSRRYI